MDAMCTTYLQEQESLGHEAHLAALPGALLFLCMFRLLVGS